jgi:hypothetical protein
MNRSIFAFTPMCFGVACLLSTAAICLPQVSAPLIGVARLGDGTLRILYGVPDNIIVDSHSLGRYASASFSDQAGLVYTGGSIELLNRQFQLLGEYNTTDANALLNTDSGAETALAWLPGSGELLHWDGTAFQATPIRGLADAFKVTSLRRNGSNAELLVSDPNGAVLEGSVSIETGELTSLTPVQGVRAPAFWASNRILFPDTNGLAVQQPDGSVDVIGAPVENPSFARISSHWVFVTSATAQRSWAVDVSAPHVRISEIPAVPATAQEGVR